jgi:DNA-binding ferritin-like protein (Dps family)
MTSELDRLLEAKKEYDNRFNYPEDVRYAITNDFESTKLKLEAKLEQAEEKALYVVMYTEMDEQPIVYGVFTALEEAEAKQKSLNNRPFTDIYKFYPEDCSGKSIFDFGAYGKL